MPEMALQTKKGQVDRQQMVVYRSMRGVTVCAIFRHVGVFEEKGTFLLPVTRGAGFLYGWFSQEVIAYGSVGIVTVCAKDFSFQHGMAARQVELRLNL